MVDRRQTTRRLRRLEKVKTWHLVILFILAAFITATFLRLNNIGMVQRRDAVLAADAEGDSSVVANRLYELQVYSSRHMNAATGDIYLEQIYKNDVKRIIDEAAAAQASTSAQPTIFRRADEVCRGQFQAYSLGYQTCMLEEQSKYTIDPSSVGMTTIQFPSSAQYRHTYISPKWSPDFAGFSFIVTIVIGILIVARIVFAAVLRAMLRYRYRSA